MSEIGVTALDHTVQETNIWLKAIGSASRSRADSRPTTRCARCCMCCATACRWRLP